MKNTSVNLPRNRSKSILCRTLFGAILVSTTFFIASAIIVVNHKQKFPELQKSDDMQVTPTDVCKTQCSLDGSEALPKGIVVKTSDLEMRPLWGPRKKRKNPKSPMSLLAMAVGKKQKANVNEMIKKFPSDNFVIMLFHYDGIVDDWKDLEWSSRAIHLSAISQTKWWFAKRFLHPDVVSEYAYIFLWDEDLGVQNFDAGRYVSIIRKEGLHISQPALDPEKSEVHHEMTTREKGSTVHRRIERMSRSKKDCYRNSTDPPCTGWVEMMAPVFSTEAWRCVWYMIQNDLIHAWGLDMQLGYCAQGNRTQYIGIVDSEYVVHYGLPTLGGSENKTNSESSKQPPQDTVLLESNHIDIRTEMWRSSTVKPDRVRDQVGSTANESTGSSNSVWKVIWQKLRRQRKKFVMRLPTKNARVSYDEYNYAQNFDQGSEWRNEIDILPRSFSVQYTNRHSPIV